MVSYRGLTLRVLGTWLGLEKLQQRGLLMALAMVMSLAGTKLLFMA